MNTLEKMAIDQINLEAINLRDMCHESNEGRMEHQRISLRSAAQKIIELVKALEENDKS